MVAELIGLCGLAGSGKSVVAKQLSRRGAFKMEKLAGPLKEMIETLYRNAGMPEAEINGRIEGDLKEEPVACLKGLSTRYAMQTLGTEWGRDALHPDLWLNLWRGRVTTALAAGINVICDDIRMPNEAAVLHQLGGRLIFIHRPSLPRNEDGHPSERPWELPHDEIILNDGTITDLRYKAEFLSL